MATPTATAKRQQAAAAQIAAECARLGIPVMEASSARDPQVRIAEILESTAAALAAVNSAVIEPEPEPARKGRK